MSEQSMRITMTCSECESGINIAPTKGAETAKCDICSHEAPVSFKDEHFEGIVKSCPCCERQDFYKQKDFNRKIGVVLFVIASVIYLFTFDYTYGVPVSLILLWLVDLLLFKKIPPVVICYKCQTIFRSVANVEDIYDFNHEMNDRIIYSDHNFHGEQLEH
jgi:hypothetical protein